MTYEYYRGLDPLVDSLIDGLVNNCSNLQRDEEEGKSTTQIRQHVDQDIKMKREGSKSDIKGVP